MIHHRVIELYFSTVMLALGLVLLAPGASFDAANYAYLRATLTEETAGAVLGCVGGLRLVAVIVNGAWRPSPLVRFAGCVVGAQFWGMMAVSFWVGSGEAIPGMLAFVVPAGAFEIYSAGRAMADAHRMRSFSLFRSRERLHGR
jgi:hypothetical protein